MTWVEGCDYAYSHPDPAGMYAAGLRFALRYFSHTPGKGLTVAERDALWDAGLGIRGLYESTATRALGGYASGRADAEQARGIARSLGYPDDLPIIFAVDFQATATQLSGPVSDYFRGIASVEAGDEAYGGIATIQALIKNHLTAGGFQTYAWSSGRWDPSAEFEQYHNGVSIAGGDVDRCRALSTARFWEAPMTAVDLTPAAVAAVRDAILQANVAAVPVAEQSGTGLTVRGSLRQTAGRTDYIANTAVPAIEAALATLSTTLGGVVQATAAAVVAALPPEVAGNLTGDQVAEIAAKAEAAVRADLLAQAQAAAAVLAPPTGA